MPSVVLLCVVNNGFRLIRRCLLSGSWWMPPGFAGPRRGGIHQLIFSSRDTHTLPSPSLFLPIYFFMLNISKKYHDYQREREQLHTPNDTHYEKKSTCCSAMCHCLTEILETV